jgi:DNA mismatch endonuclease, patch repair protein
MADIVDKATRSRMMSGIRGKNTKPELLARKLLHREGLRFALHANLPGKPDIVLPRHRSVVFVHGCFWHRHPGCRFTTTPATNTEKWQDKFDKNVKRDLSVTRQLRALGWHVYKVWACSIDETRMKRLAKRIKGHS